LPTRGCRAAMRINQMPAPNAALRAMKAGIATFCATIPPPYHAIAWLNGLGKAPPLRELLSNPWTGRAVADDNFLLSSAAPVVARRPPHMLVVGANLPGLAGYILGAKIRTNRSLIAHKREGLPFRAVLPLSNRGR
jgi:hypothetical protein